MRTALILLSLLALLGVARPANALTVSDDRGVHELQEPARRVVALAWSTAEMVVGLGVKPLAIADVEGYGKWVARPPLPDGVADVGLRGEPNLERIAALEPDLIIASDDQRDLVPRLEQIAPVLYFDLFSIDHDNFDAGRAAFLKIAAALGKESEGERRLDALDAELERLRGTVAEHFEGTPPKVTPIRFMSDAVVRVHSENSMATAALAAIGVAEAWPQPRTAWGISLKKVEELAAIEDGTVIYIEPLDSAEGVLSTPLWSFMPFVRAERFTSIPPTWTFGGPLSVGYLAQSFADALIALDDGPAVDDE